MIIGHGKNGTVRKYEDKKFGVVAVKRYKICNLDMYTRIQNEAKYLLKLKQLHKDGIYPGEIYALKTNINPRDKFEYNYLKKKKPYIMMKYYEMELNDFISDYHAKWIYKSILFQTVVQLIVIHKYLQIYHRDIHTRNILINRCTTPNITYMIDGTPYLVPTYGYRTSIIDFENSNNDYNPESYDIGGKLPLLYHTIIYYRYKYEISKNSRIIDAINLLRKDVGVDVGVDLNVNSKNYKEIWSWYDQTGKIDKKLFLFLVNSGFDYSFMLDNKYLSLVKYYTKLCNSANIKKDVINASDVNLSAFGYKCSADVRIDYRI